MYVHAGNLYRIGLIKMFQSQSKRKWDEFHVTITSVLCMKGYRMNFVMLSRYILEIKHLRPEFCNQVGFVITPPWYHQLLWVTLTTSWPVIFYSCYWFSFIVSFSLLTPSLTVSKRCDQSPDTITKKKEKRASYCKLTSLINQTSVWFIH